MIKYKDLSWPLKVAVVVAWIDLVFMSLSFMVGFMSAFI